MNTWDEVATVYGIIAVATSLPVVIPMLRAAKRFHSDADSSRPIHFSHAAHQRWSNYYSTILSEVNVWRKRATIYKRFHYYYAWWTIISSWLIPLIGTTLGGGEAKWLIVVISSHVALALSIYRRFKVGENLRAVTIGESDFHDLNRRLEHQPHTLGNTDDEQLTAYVAAAEDIRKNVRAAQTVGLGDVESGDNRRA